MGEMKAFVPLARRRHIHDPERAGFFSNQHAANGEGIGVGIQIQGFKFSVLVAAQMSIRRVEPYRAAASSQADSSRPHGPRARGQNF